MRKPHLIDTLLHVGTYDPTFRKWRITKPRMNLKLTERLYHALLVLLDRAIAVQFEEI